MNGLEDLLDRIDELLRQLWNRLEENSTFNTIREQFETLPTSTQRIVKLGAVGLTTCLIFFIPVSGIMESSNYIDEFEVKRELIQNLIAAEKGIKQGSPLPPGMTSQAMQTRIQGKVQYMRLIEGQGPEMSALGEAVAGTLAPKAVKQAGLRVNFFGLNLKQVLDVGSELESLDASVKMIGLKIQPSKKFQEYYDASFDIVSFSLPVADSPGDGEADGKDAKAGKKGSKRPKRPSRSRRSRRSRSKEK